MMWCQWALILISAGLCEAYSTSSSTARRLPILDSASITAAIDPSISPPNNVVSKPLLGRRAFFHHGTAAALATTAISLPANAASSSSPLSLGAPAPEFSLVNTRGQIITLDSLTSSGKWTVLYFYPGAFTSGCTLEARKFQEDLASFQDLNAQVVGVSVDSVEKNSEFCKTEALDFYMLTDEGGKISKAYGSALSIPGFGTFSNRQTYIIDPEKKVRWMFTDVESHIPRHANEVLEKLKELKQL